MSLPDTIFIFGLALVIFGPKKLPEIGRQIGKLLFEFRRASNDFKLQIEEELRAAEFADRKNASQAPITDSPALPAAPAEAKERLTIRPPATGVTVSADAPTAGASAAPSEPALQESSLDAAAGIREDGPLNGDFSEHPGLDAGEPIPHHHG